MKPEIILLQDIFIMNWITSWVLAQCKLTIGEAREKFASIVGPGGGTSLNGASMKAEGFKLQEELLLELKNYTTGGEILTWVQG